MAKKVKCIECIHFMGIALPENVTEKNYENAICYLNIATEYEYCEQTEKMKKKSHEQYCKHFVKNENIKEQEYLQDRITELKNKIEEYERENLK